MLKSSLVVGVFAESAKGHFSESDGQDLTIR